MLFGHVSVKTRNEIIWNHMMLRWITRYVQKARTLILLEKMRKERQLTKRAWARIINFRHTKLQILRNDSVCHARRAHLCSLSSITALLPLPHATIWYYILIIDMQDKKTIKIYMDRLEEKHSRGDRQRVSTHSFKHMKAHYLRERPWVLTLFCHHHPSPL